MKSIFKITSLISALLFTSSCLKEDLDKWHTPEEPKTEDQIIYKGQVDLTNAKSAQISFYMSQSGYQIHFANESLSVTRSGCQNEISLTTAEILDLKNKIGSIHLCKRQSHEYIQCAPLIPPPFLILEQMAPTQYLPLGPIDYCSHEGVCGDSDVNTLENLKTQLESMITCTAS